MKEKIILEFDEKKYFESLKDLKLNLRKLEQALECIEQIVGVRELKTLDEVEKFITDKTGFQNVIASAELLNVLQQLVYLQNHLQSIEFDKIENDKGTYVLKESVLKQLKNDCTTYLDECFVDDFNLLSKAIIPLNKLSTPNLVNCLKRDFTGQYSVSKVALQNSKLIC
jgi:hypothetical protein